VDRRSVVRRRPPGDARGNRHARSRRLKAHE
jgi:hypothetical protein